jgi:hypothetical protein
MADIHEELNTSTKVQHKSENYRAAIISSYMETKEATMDMTYSSNMEAKKHIKNNF